MHKSYKHINERILSDEEIDYIGKKMGIFKEEPKLFNFNGDSSNEPVVEPTNNSNAETSVSPKPEEKHLVKLLGNNVPSLFRQKLSNVANIHDQIVDLYTNTLYEDNWDDATIEKFESLLNEYNDNLKYLKDNLNSIEWQSDVTRRQFMQIFKDVVVSDAEAWNRVQVRNTNYRRYRTNRKSIILQLADIIGGLSIDKKLNQPAIFRYYNNKCAQIKLYDNTDKREKKEFLSTWFKEHLNDIQDELRDQGILHGSIDSVVLYRVFNLYVKCRKTAYAIFNLMTSNSEFNGFNKWHNRIIDYCDATLNDRQLEILVNAVSSEGQFEDVDDYHNIMDEQSWERKGINESWFDDEMDWYQNNKDRYTKDKIAKVSMVPTNANICRVICDGKNVYANANFYPGDIIEICPTKTIDKSALYSRDMRTSVFEVVPNEQWVLPFGYCNFYIPNDLIEEPNCTYIWDPIKKVIVIKAINKIQKHSKLLLKIDF